MINDLNTYLLSWNSVAWVLSNVVIAYSSLMVLVFVIGYYVLFNPRATTAGRYIFQFFVSLLAILALVCVGLFVDPPINHVWYQYPGDVVFWRPTVRLVAYLFVAFNITSLAMLLVVRKWHPHKLRVAIDRDSMQPRTEQHTT